MPRRSVPATTLVTALMDLAGLTEVEITEQELAKVTHDELVVRSSETDPTVPAGAYRLQVRRQRPQIVVAGSLAHLDEHRPREIGGAAR